MHIHMHAPLDILRSRKAPSKNSPGERGIGERASVCVRFYVLCKRRSVAAVLFPACNPSTQCCLHDLRSLTVTGANRCRYSYSTGLLWHAVILSAPSEHDSLPPPLLGSNLFYSYLLESLKKLWQSEYPVICFVHIPALFQQQTGQEILLLQSSFCLYRCEIISVLLGAAYQTDRCFYFLGLLKSLDP